MEARAQAPQAEGSEANTRAPAEDESEAAGHEAAVQEASQINSASEGLSKRERRKRARAAKPTSEERTNHFLAWPVILMEKGVGLTLGAAGVFAHRPPEYRRSKVHIFATGRSSLKKAQEYIFQIRLFDLAGASELFDINFTYRNDPVFPFFGIPGPVHLHPDELVDERYEVHLRSLEPEFNYAHTLYIRPSPPESTRPKAYLRGVLGWRMEADHATANPDSALSMQRPDTLGRTRRGVYYTGISWDSRDNDWNPHRGALHDVTVASAGPWSGSTSVWTRLNASLRFYNSLGSPKVVYASEVLFDTFVGRPPALVLAHFGGLLEKEGIGSRNIGRGYFRRRFGSATKLYTSHEFRITPVKARVFRWNLEIGFKPFVDVGWTFTRDPVSQRIRPYVHPSVGFGVYFVWDEFVVIRIDAAFGAEGRALYMSNGHAF
jgi:hypothetical protein